MQDFLSRFVRSYFWLIATALVWTIFAVLIAASRPPALAHGDAQWIMDNGRYVDQNGTHCCGPSDCRREHASKFQEVSGGIAVSTGAGDVILMQRDLVGRGLYPSIDDNWWICIRGGVVRCVFKPSTGG